MKHRADHECTARAGLRLLHRMAHTRPYMLDTNALLVEVPEIVQVDVGGNFVMLLDVSREERK